MWTEAKELAWHSKAVNKLFTNPPSLLPFKSTSDSMAASVGGPETQKKLLFCRNIKVCSLILNEGKVVKNKHENNCKREYRVILKSDNFLTF